MATTCKICGKHLHRCPTDKEVYDKCLSHTLKEMGFVSISKEQWLKNQNMQRFS